MILKSTGECTVCPLTPKAIIRNQYFVPDLSPRKVKNAFVLPSLIQTVSEVGGSVVYWCM
jgi:hypothetical protein